jgi:hypothetical protein
MLRAIAGVLSAGVDRHRASYGPSSQPRWGRLFRETSVTGSRSREGGNRSIRYARRSQSNQMERDQSVLGGRNSAAAKPCTPVQFWLLFTMNEQSARAAIVALSSALVVIGVAPTSAAEVRYDPGDTVTSSSVHSRA